jgi:hypothetical protein
MSVPWAATLDVDPESDRALFFRRLAAVVELPGEVRHAVESLRDVDHELLLKRLPEVEAAMKTVHNLANPSSQFLNNITDATLDGLEHCSSLLHIQCPERVPDTATLDGIRQSLSELVEEVIRAKDLDQELQSFLFDHLSEMLRAMQDFRFRGVKPLEQATQRAVGNCVVRHDIAENATKHSLGKRFFELLSRLLVVLSVAHTGYQLAVPFLPELPPGEEKPPIVVITENQLPPD